MKKRFMTGITAGLSVLAVLVASTALLLAGSTSASATESPCIDKATWSYTFDGVASGTITVAAEGATQGDKLCDALAVRAAIYQYIQPASGSPSWPQKLKVYNDVLVDSIGTFSYGAAGGTCQQGDVYAAWVSSGGFDSLGLPDVLKGPGNPYEPQSLDRVLPGMGPSPTYSYTTSEGCNTPPETPQPTTTYTEWKDSAWVCGDATVSQTRTAVTTTYSWELKDGKWVKIETKGEPVVETQTRPLTDAEVQACKPATPAPDTATTGWVDQQKLCTDETVTQTNTTNATQYDWTLQSGAWVKVIAAQTSSQETRTRPMTDKEKQACPAMLAATGVSDAGMKAYPLGIALLVSAGVGLLHLSRRRLG